MEHESESLARGLAMAWLHLAVLWAFAVAQPLFEVLGDSPEFFVARDNTRWDIVVLAFGLTLVPPTALAAIELILSPVPPARRVAHAGFVAVLLAAIALQVLDRLFGGLAPEVLIALAMAAGVCGALLYVKGRLLRLILTVLAPAPAVFLAVFLFVSPVSELVLPQGSVAASDARLRGQTPVTVLVLDGSTEHRCSTGSSRSTRPATQLREAGGRLPLVPQCDHRRRRHSPGGARHSQWQPSPDRRAPDCRGPPAQPVHAPRPQVRLQRPGGGHGAVPGEPLRRDRAGGGGRPA